jgi:hypothetical protein
MDSGFVGLVGAVIGSGAVLLGQFFTNRHQRLLAQEESTRNRLYEIYQGVLANLNGPERDRWFDLLIIYFPKFAQKQLDSVLAKMRRGALRRHDVIHLALADERLAVDRLRPIAPPLLPSYDLEDPANQIPDPISSRDVAT